MDFTIRPGTKEDIPSMLQLIKELAEFEKAPKEVENTEQKILEEGFGENPIFGFYVAEADGMIAGMAVYYYRYSTWKGKRLFLEDLIVNENYRGKGLGKKLFEICIKHSIENNCNGMAWQVLDWNTPAIDFYKKYGSKLEPEWVNCSLSLSQLKEISSTI